MPFCRCRDKEKPPLPDVNDAIATSDNVYEVGIKLPADEVDEFARSGQSSASTTNTPTPPQSGGEWLHKKSSSMVPCLPGRKPFDYKLSSDPTQTRTEIVAEPQSAEGESAGRDKIFGADVDTSDTVLSAIVGAIAWLDANWLHAEGLWRRPGIGPKIKAAVPQVDETGAFPMDDDCHTLVSLLVKFIAMIPGRLLSAAAATQFLAALQDPTARFEVILSNTTTPAKCAVFGALVTHWARVAAEPQNRMDSKAMATCVFCVLFDGPMNLQLVHVMQRFIEHPSCCGRPVDLEKVKLRQKQHTDAMKMLQYTMSKLFDATIGNMIDSWLIESLKSRYSRFERKYTRAMECGIKYGWSLRKCIEAGERIEAELSEHGNWTNTGSEEDAALQLVMEIVMAEVEQTQVRGVGQKMIQLNVEYSRLSSRFTKAMEVAMEQNWPLPKCVAIGSEIEKRVEGVKKSSQPAAALYYVTEFVEAEQQRERERNCAVKIQAVFRGSMTRKQRLNVHGITAAHLRSQRRNKSRVKNKRIYEFDDLRDSVMHRGATFSEGLTCTDVFANETHSEELNCESDAVKCMRVAGVQQETLQILQDQVDAREDQAADFRKFLDFAMRRVSTWDVESKPAETGPRHPVDNECIVCKAYAVTRCKACEKFWYCSLGCQQKDWKLSHQFECGNNADNSGQKHTHSWFNFEPAKCPEPAKDNAKHNARLAAAAAETQPLAMGSDAERNEAKLESEAELHRHWNQMQEQQHNRVSLSPKSKKYSAPSA